MLSEPKLLTSKRRGKHGEALGGETIAGAGEPIGELDGSGGGKDSQRTVGKEHEGNRQCHHLPAATTQEDEHGGARAPPGLGVRERARVRAGGVRSGPRITAQHFPSANLLTMLQPTVLNETTRQWHSEHACPRVQTRAWAP